MPQIAPSQSSDANSLNVLSIPEIPVPPLGVFQLPPANQAGPSGPASGGETGQSGNSAQTGSPVRSASPVARAGDARASDNGRVADSGRVVAGPGPPGAASASTIASASPAPGRNASPSESGPATGASTIADGQTSADAAAGRTVAKVVLPQDGHFGVLIESSGSEGFAEAEGVLGGKLVYTVYVRAGARKEWILQYCLPRGVERSLPATVKPTAPEAPFPYVILRPDITFGPDIDYLIVHGIVTALGRLDQLSYVTAPEEQAEKDQLLHSLRQWQFRPGKLDNQPIALEVLLIIPRDKE